MKRRNVLSLLGVSLLLPAALRQAFAQKPDEVSLVVPFTPGGGGDNFARSALDFISKSLGKTIWVANRPGAGGNIGTHSVTASAPDGKTLGYVTNGIMCVNPLLYKNANFDPQKDLIPVSQLSKIGLVAVLNPNAVKGVTDLKSLIDYAGKNPGVINFASSGVGTTSHLAGQYFAQKTGTNLTHIPHSGGATAIVEVLAGRIPFMIDVSSNVLQHIKSGALKPMGVTTPERLSSLPDVLTLQEAGIPGFELYAWDGFVLPKGASPETVAQFSEAISKLKNDPQAQARIRALGAEPVFSNSKEFEAFIRTETPKWHKLVGEINAQKK